MELGLGVICHLECVNFMSFWILHILVGTLSSSEANTSHIFRLSDGVGGRTYFSQTLFGSLVSNSSSDVFLLADVVLFVGFFSSLLIKKPE